MESNVRTGLGMIDSMFNMVCDRGHRHFAPHPEKFVGKECIQRDVAGVGEGGKGECGSTLQLIEQACRE